MTPPQQQSNRKFYKSESQHNHGCEKQGERINALERDVKRLMQTVFYGNGHPSMQQQVQELSDWSKTMKDDIKRMQSIFYKLAWMFVATIIAAILNAVIRQF